MILGIDWYRLSTLTNEEGVKEVTGKEFLIFYITMKF